MLRDFSLLFFDRTCFSCDKELITGEAHVCWDCLSQMQETGFHLSPEENEAYYRLGGKVPLDGIACLYFFDKAGRLQRLMRALKYQGAPQLGFFLGELLGEQLAGSDFLREVEVLLPVPLHPSKLRGRGYNQAEWIARGMASQTRLRVETRQLFRKRRTLTQTRKSGSERWKNVKGAFLAAPAPPAHVLLVDDVLTTGSTLEACIAALHELPEPPKSIRIATIGMARRE